MEDKLSAIPSDTRRKSMTFRPKVPQRRAPKRAEVKCEEPHSVDANDKWLKLAKGCFEKMKPSPERKGAPVQVAFGYGNTSVSPGFASILERSNHIAANNYEGGVCASDQHVAGKEYIDPWDYYSYYPVSLPLRRPYSENPELLNAKEFGEASSDLVHDGTHVNAATELSLMGELNEEQLVLFQLPSSLPLVKRSTAEKDKELKNAGETLSTESAVKQSYRLDDLPAGFMGKLLVYKSGKVKMKLGDSLFDVNPGVSCIFAQDVAVINPLEKHCSVIGELNKRAVVTPDVDSLLDSISGLG